MRCADETANFLHAMIDLVTALKERDPELAVALDVGRARVAFDERERMILVSVIDEHGAARPLLAVQADPFDRDQFGMAGIPEPVFDLHRRSTLPS